MFYYKDEITLNNKFNKSTNIIHDKEDCKHYIITQSTKDTLSTFFKLDYHNSLALIGPFGCGKSSLLLYINTLLSKTKESQKCIEALKKSHSTLYEEYKNFIDKKSFLRVKMVGEHTSFKSKFRDVFLDYSSFTSLFKYLKSNEDFKISKALEILNRDIKKSNYSDVLFSIDEFGKFIEYGLEDNNSNDIFELQTLAEYINKQSNYKLIISLHKAFGEYNSRLSTISYSDWDKIQGRFETIVFKDDYYEMLNIFKETIVLKDSKIVKKAQNGVYQIYANSKLKESEENQELFEKIVPIHPFSAIVISEIFTRYFQNQRSIFSFLFSTEPFAFQEFISKKQYTITLYSLSDLYRYVGYLLKVYNILLPDRELWYLAEHRLQEYKAKDKLKIELIQTITLVHTFKLANVIPTNREYLILSLMDRYSIDEIEEEIDSLSKDGLLLFQEKTQSFSLIEEANIDINRELENRLSRNSNLNLEKELNRFILNKKVVAKRYFAEYGNKKSFEKIYVDKSKKLFQEDYKLFLTQKENKELFSLSKQHLKSLFIPISNLSKIETLVKKIEALSDIKDEFKSVITLDTKEILENMINDYTIVLEQLINDGSTNRIVIFNGKEYPCTNQQIQQLISDIVEKAYPNAPKINNYTFSHTLVSKGTNTTNIKKLFEAIMKNSDKEYLGIDKYPAHKALYLSVIEPAGIHKKINEKWKLCSPNDLNFEKVWSELDRVLSKKINLEKIVKLLEKEPYGLNKLTAMFIISLYILVNEEKIHIISDNTYKYMLTLDLLMNMWKVTHRYQLQLIKLTKDEANLFKAYVEITTDLTEYSYSKDKVVSIVKTLHSKFTLLPHYAKNSQKLSKEAIALRSALISMKDPKEAFFSMFPKALGYQNIKNISNDEFIQKFKGAFNEIALVYKKEIGGLEQFISKIFHFETPLFPYGNGLITLSEKLSAIDGLDIEIKALLRSFNFSNTTLELIDNISVILIQKKIEDCYDNDINILKDKLKIIANKILSKLELADVSTEHKDVRKISLASLDESLNRVISIDKSKLDTINQKALKLKEMIPSEYSNDEKLFLISQLLNEELKNE